jgi:DnaJ domain
LQPHFLKRGRPQMFERNPVDTGRMMTVAVAITLKDGTTVAGRTAMPHGRSIARLMEGAEAFLYVETLAGETAFVPKSEIRGLKVVDAGRPLPLKVGPSDASHFDAHAVLGVERGAPMEAIRAAYIKLTRSYHPDQFAAVALPPEVKTYLDQRCKQINAAFELIEASHKAGALR